MGLSINGRISLQDIKNEFGDPDGDGQFKFSEYYLNHFYNEWQKKIYLIYKFTISYIIDYHMKLFYLRITKFIYLLYKKL